MKTLNDFIVELIKIQEQGKGKYSVIDGYAGEEIDYISIYDDSKEIVI